MKTNVSFSDVFQADKIGTVTNLNVSNISGNTTSKRDKDVLVLGIDFQNDFMEYGNLAVQNSLHDVKHFAEFIYHNAEKIDDIYMSLDTHVPNQIFHPCWWSNEKGEHPHPFTSITAQDVENGIWKANFFEKESLSYLKGLESTGKKQLMVWSYHCLQGSFGSAVEPQLSNLLLAFTLYKGKDVLYLTKGLNPITEMYGIVKPEFSPTNTTDYHLIKDLTQYEKIFIGGEAKSHCVYESIKQIAEVFEEIGHTHYTLYLLEDCMSSITGFETETERLYKELTEKYPIKIVNSSFRL